MTLRCASGAEPPVVFLLPSGNLHSLRRVKNAPGGARAERSTDGSTLAS